MLLVFVDLTVPKILVERKHFSEMTGHPGESQFVLVEDLDNDSMTLGVVANSQTVDMQAAYIWVANTQTVDIQP